MMDGAIKQTLKTVEEQRNVRILYACEAGSRAWGIESKDSDYDVRFIYAYPRERYLGLDVPRDVIELPVTNDLDVNGWDIYKALRLLRKSNPALLEWLHSPVVYLENSPTIAEMRDIAQSLIAPKVCLHYHYHHMASGNYQQYIKDKSPVLTKKYLYVIRPLIVQMYLEQYGVLPETVNLPTTLASVKLSMASITESEERRRHINDLIARKQAGDELGMAAPDLVLNAFIDERLEHWRTQTFSDSHDRTAMQRETAAILQAVLNEEGDEAAKLRKEIAKLQEERDDLYDRYMYTEE